MSRVTVRPAKPPVSIGRADPPPPEPPALSARRRALAEQTAPAERGALPSAGELFKVWHEGWCGALLLEAAGSFAPTSDPLARSLNGARPIANAAAYRETLASREQLASYRWAQSFARELSAAAWRLLVEAERTWSRAYTRGRHDAGGALSQAPRGPLLDFARWQRRNQDAEALAAGRFDPEASLVPPGAPPPFFADPLPAANAVFVAAATVRALEARCFAHPHLKASPFPEALLRRVRVAEDKARADLTLCGAILRTLSDRREWEPLLALDPDAAQPEARTLGRLWAEANMAAKRQALTATGFWEFGPSTEPLSEQGRGIDGRRCWWGAHDSEQREACWSQLSARREALRADLAQLGAQIADADLPADSRRRAFESRIAAEDRLREVERELEALAGAMLAEPSA